MASPLSEPPSPHVLTFALCFEHHLRVCQGDAHSAVPTTTVGTRLRTGRDKTSRVVISQAVLLLKKTLLCTLLGKNKNHVLILEGQALCWLSPPYWSSPSLTTDVPRWLPGSLQGQEPTVWLLTKKP